MALNAIMLISEISMMAIKDCYIDLEFLKLNYGCYFTLVCVHGCTHTVCRNVVVVYWWGSFPLSVSNPIFREKLIHFLPLCKIEAKISNSHCLWTRSAECHGLRFFWFDDFLFYFVVISSCDLCSVSTSCSPVLPVFCSPPVFPCWCPWTSTHGIEVLPIPGLLSCEQGSAVDSHLPFKASKNYLKPGLSE